jgi:RNA polymerase sigma factor (sigma-70 family)
LLHNEKYNQSSDAELTALFFDSGDNALIGILYERYGHLVLGLCLKYLKNRDEARDATLRIFEDLITDLRRHRVEYFKSWLYTYSRNFCLMELRKRQTLLKKELELKMNAGLVMESGDGSHLKEKEEQYEMMERAMEQLNSEQRTCVDLFYLRNHSYNEIAALTGFSAKDVKSHIQNGKRNLKIKIEALMNEQAGKR